MHFLGAQWRRSGSRDIYLSHPHAAVRVRVVKKTLVLDPEEKCPIFVLRTDAVLREVPDTVEVFGPDGKRIRPSGRFLITTETFDPYHCLLDLTRGYE